jgi:hypothetical protein
MGEAKPISIAVRFRFRGIVEAFSLLPTVMVGAVAPAKKSHDRVDIKS